MPKLVRRVFHDAHRICGFQGNLECEEYVKIVTYELIYLTPKNKEHDTIFGESNDTYSDYLCDHYRCIEGSKLYE